MGRIIQDLVDFDKRAEKQKSGGDGWLAHWIPIPSTKEEKEAWHHAADTWRLPYWDPAVRRAYNNNGACIPEAMMAAELTSGSASIPIGSGIPGFPNRNPFYAYEYPDDNLEKYGMANVTDKNGKVLIPVCLTH